MRGSALHPAARGGRDAEAHALKRLNVDDGLVDRCTHACARMRRQVQACTRAPTTGRSGCIHRRRLLRGRTARPFPPTSQRLLSEPTSASQRSAGAVGIADGRCYHPPTPASTAAARKALERTRIVLSFDAEKISLPLSASAHLPQRLPSRSVLSNRVLRVRLSPLRLNFHSREAIHPKIDGRGNLCERSHPKGQTMHA